MTSAAVTVAGALGLAAGAAALVIGMQGTPPTVEAALTARVTTAQTTTAASYSIVVNGTSGAKALAVTGGSAPTFTLNNNGATNLGAMTVRVTNQANRSVRICASGGSCNSGGVTIASGSTATITHSAAQRPTAAGSAVTWSYRRASGSSGGTSGTITVTVDVSSANATRPGGSTL